MSERLQNVLVCVLLLAALGGVFLEVSRDPKGGSEAITPAQGDSVEATAPPTPQAPGSDTNDARRVDDARTTTAAPAESDAGSAESDEPATLAEALRGDTDELVTVLLLGDGTSNTRSEWVHEWGQLAAEERPVTVVHWDEMGDISYTDPDVLSVAGSGTPLTIWSASRTGADVASATSRLDLFLPEEGEPDAVILNFGRNDTYSIAGDLDDLLAVLREEVGDVPVGIVRQPDRDSGDSVQLAVQAWAGRNDVMVLDASEQDSARDWARTVMKQLEP